MEASPDSCMFSHQLEIKKDPRACDDQKRLGLLVPPHTAMGVTIGEQKRLCCSDNTKTNEVLPW